LAQTPKDPASLDPAWQPLLQRLVADGFEQTALETLFARMGPQSYTPAYMGLKITELYGVPGIGINREKSPPPIMPEGYTPPVNDTSVGSCLAFIQEHAATLADIEKKYGVQAPVILAILLVETGLGQDLGKDSALRALASMAATHTPEMLASMGNSRQKARVSPASLARTLREKSGWAYAELKALICHAEQLNRDPAGIPGSMYGAVGICQFMPSNIELFGVAGDNDGGIDLFNLVDAMYSVASYLEGNGWRGAATDALKNQVILTYNKDTLYASTVLATSKRLENALKGTGKISPRSSAVVGGYSKNPYARLDPSLRRLRSVPPSARVNSLGDYQQMLQ
jgi:membrane-bound lytic murein transglycosylase B